MHFTSARHSEVILSIEVAVEMANEIVNERLDARTILIEGGFSGASEASEAAIQRVGSRMANLMGFINQLPEADLKWAIEQVNEGLAELPISPSIVDHDGVGLHIHWTPASAKFDDRVISDIVMSIAEELATNGTDRFGRCSAEDCECMFYDRTRNGSKRFCSDPKCASRTHTADHRARRKSAS